MTINQKKSHVFVVIIISDEVIVRTAPSMEKIAS